MSALISVALAPALIAAIYLYMRDKYEKEPWHLLGFGVLYGGLVTVPIVHTENFVTRFIPNTAGVLGEAAFLAFAVAALVEEFYKYAVLFFLVWRNRNFNEPFDGIVYAAFISLGFAGTENVLYVLNPELGGMETALSRALFAVPGHALFGIAMGYYFAMARFEPRRKFYFLSLALLMPFLLHGTYNFILLSQMPYLMVVFAAYVVWLWISGFRKMRAHIKASPFAP